MAVRDPAALTFRRAAPPDATALSAFARGAFIDAFGAENRPEDMAAYVAATYSVELQEAELRDDARDTIVIESAGVIAGYAQLRDGPAPECVADPGPVELLRFYVDRSLHGSGAAQRLMAETLAAAVARGARSIWLSVWERNPRAIAFYERSGFTAAGSAVFVLGADRQTDRVMARRLGPS